MIKIKIRVDCENAPKKKLVRDFNIAFASNNIEQVLSFFSDDIIWNMVGGKVYRGKTEIKKMLDTMEREETNELVVNNILTHGDTASADGQLGFNNSTIAFCDIYKFSGSKIKNLTSYAIEIG